MFKNCELTAYTQNGICLIPTILLNERDKLQREGTQNERGKLQRAGTHTERDKLQKAGTQNERDKLMRAGTPMKETS